MCTALLENKKKFKKARSVWPSNTSKTQARPGVSFVALGCFGGHADFQVRKLSLQSLPDRACITACNLSVLTVIKCLSFHVSRYAVV